MCQKINKRVALASLAVILTALLVIIVPAAWASISHTPVVNNPPSSAVGVVRVTTNRDGSTDVVQVFKSPNVVGQVTVDSHTSAPVLVHTGSTSATTKKAIGSTSACAGKTYFSRDTQTISAHITFIPFGHTSQTMGWYWNCSKAWIASRFSWDKAGYHRCGGGWAIGVSVDVQECTKTNDPASNGADVKPYDRFKVSAIFNGFPYAFTKYMQACLSAHGGAWDCQ